MTGTDDGEPGLLAHRCPAGHLTYPGHPTCPECGRAQTERVDLSEMVGEVVTWTESHATPPGVREPNTLAVVSFDVEGEQVRVLGGTTDAVVVGESVEPVYVGELRDPDPALRHRESQAWDGYRFRPLV